MAAMSWLSSAGVGVSYTLLNGHSSAALTGRTPSSAFICWIITRFSRVVQHNPPIQDYYQRLQAFPGLML
jgi:hypothetical protein